MVPRESVGVQSQEVKCNGYTMKELPPPTKLELTRMAHARAQELHLPGSPAGVNGHSNLTRAARSNFKVTHWSELKLEDMKRIIEYMDERRRLPEGGELKS
jgi:hypothetical protein